MTLHALKSKSLAEFAIQALGYAAVRGKDTPKYRILATPCGNGQIYSKNAPNKSGHYTYGICSGEAGGTVIDLLIKQHSQTTAEAITTVRDFWSGTRPTPVTREPATLPTLSLDDQTKKVQLRISHYQKRQPKSYGYLLKRGISKEVAASYPLLCNDNSLLTPMYRFGEGKWQLVTSHLEVQLAEKRIKHFQKGISKRGGLAVLKRKGHNPAAFCLTESAIEALSLETLRKKQGKQEPVTYLSFMGRYDTYQLTSLTSLLLSLLEKRNISLCIALNNDKAGKKMTAAVMQQLQGISGLQVTSFYPKEKDWNEQLTSDILRPL